MGLLAKLFPRFRRSRQQIDLSDFYAQFRRSILGTYDAARTTDEFDNYWKHVDSYDADTAHSRDVRHRVTRRARYEVANNGYADGIVRTYANDLVGCGPSLRMQTASQPFNEMVERQWRLWSDAVGLPGKLWTMGHAKPVDGEAFGVIRLNRIVDHPLPLDVTLHETEQIQSPAEPYGDPTYIDGIKFDEWGNPLWYDLLQEHPGNANAPANALNADRIPAGFVLHWFRRRRPGQHRGICEFVSALNVGAASRRWRESTLSAADTAATFSVLLKTGFPPDQVDAVAPMSTMDIQKRMMVTLPQGWDASQLKAEQPTAMYEAFHRTLINEFARPLSMPFNKAAADSASYNYASGRLDHQTYYQELDVERHNANAAVLDKLFAVWFAFAVETFGWIGGDSTQVSPRARAHVWDWPKHKVADIQAEANANDTKLRSGQLGLRRLYSDAGLDIEDEFNADAEFFGIDVDEYKRRWLDVLAPASQQASPSINEEPGVRVAAGQRPCLTNGHAATNGFHRT